MATLSQILFIIVSIGTTLYQAYRRKIDIFSVAHAAATVYFMPGFWGVDIFDQALVPAVYYIMAGVLSSISLTQVCASVVRIKPISTRVGNPGTAFPWLLVAFLGSVAMALWYSSGQVFWTPKTEVNIPGEVYIIWRLSASLLFMYALVLRNGKWMWIGGIGIASVFLAADRTNIAIILCSLLLFLGRDTRLGLHLIKPSHIIGAVGMISGIIWGKVLFISLSLWHSHGLDKTIDFLRSVEWSKYIVRSEPFLTQGLLNTFLKEKFYVGPGHLKGLVVQIFPVPSLLGYDSGVFNDMFQPILFGQSIEWGMAYNYWGEAYASGGILMILLFIGLFCIGLFTYDWLLKTRDPLLLGGILYAAPFVAFYIHRNSILTTMTYQRHIGYVVVGIVILCMLRSLWGQAGRARGAVYN